MSPLVDSSPDSSCAASVSVVVPSFNHAGFVEAALRSIFTQTLAPSGLLVIDDGSTDGSPRLIERALQDCPFSCELIARANRGLCATLNEGLGRSRGRYFAYLSSDDLWLPEFLRARVALLETRRRAVLAYGHAYLVDEQNQVIDCTEDWAHYADGDARAMLLQTTAPMSPTVVYRRDALARHGWHEGTKLEDYDLYLRLSAEGDFAFDPRVLSAWRRHGHNTSRDQTMMLDEHLRAQRRVYLSSGMSAGELERHQRMVKFNRAEDFLRLGHKAEALGLMWRNLGGATTSGRALARMLVRLCVPFRLLERRRLRRERRAAARYSAVRF
ncbi:MAG: glycosyltransferase family 2 protein [Pyrinomonadaceae bacterium]